MPRRIHAVPLGMRGNMGRRKHTERTRTELLKGIHSTRLHLILYSLLLVATPFIMLRAYMQQAIGRLSLSKIPFGAMEIPTVPLMAAGLLGIIFAISVPASLAGGFSPPAPESR